jgi:hypothetical protein
MRDYGNVVVHQREEYQKRSSTRRAGRGGGGGWRNRVVGGVLAIAVFGIIAGTVSWVAGKQEVGYAKYGYQPAQAKPHKPKLFFKGKDEEQQ